MNEELLSSVAVELTTVISPASTTFISKQWMCTLSPPPIRTQVSGGFIIKKHDLLMWNQVTPAANWRFSACMRGYLCIPRVGGVFIV